MIGAYYFLSCVSVCLSVVNFNFHYNVLTFRDRDFILGIHFQLIMPFQNDRKVDDLMSP